MSIVDYLTELSLKGAASIYRELKKIRDIRVFCTSIVNADEPVKELLIPIVEIMGKLERSPGESGERSPGIRETIGEWLNALRSVSNELIQRGVQKDIHIVERHLIFPFLTSDGSDIISHLEDTIPRLELATATVMPDDEPTFCEILSQDVMDLIQQLDRVEASGVLDIPGVNTDNFPCLFRHIRTLIYENESLTRRYTVAGLFWDKPDYPGVVQNIHVRVSAARPEAEEPRIEYGFRIEDSEKGEMLRRSVEDAAAAASNLLGIIQDVWVDIEEELETEYSEDSLGLAVAAAMLARATNQVIGVETAGDVAITGTVTVSGEVGPVGGVREKAEAIAQINKLPYRLTKISHMVVPDKNAHEVPQDSGLTVREVSHVEDLSQILFDPWRDYLDSFETYPHLPISEEVQMELVKPDSRRISVCKRFADDASVAADSIARQLAQNRLDLLKLSDYHYPIPVRLDVRSFRRDTRLSEIVTEHASQQCIQAGFEGVETVHDSLRDGHIALIFDGLDTYSELDFFKPGAAMRADIESYYHKNQLVFVCSESSWHRHSGGIKDPDMYELLKLYDGRSTFLDDHIRKTMEQKAPNLILPCRTAEVELSAFFQGVEKKGRYIELKVQKLNREGGGQRKIHSLGDVVRDGQDRHILLVGDGGSGKTTALLKLMFDYSDKQLTSEEDLLIAPMFIHADDLAERRSIANLAWNIRSDQVDRELRDTRDILIMVDGLNEVKPENEESLLTAIRRLVEDYPQHRVILTSRRQEYARAEAILSKDIVQDNFEQYELLALDFSDARSYLAAVMKPELAKQAMTALGSQADVIANPMMVYLMSTIPNELEDQMAERRKLTRGWIYQAAVKKWLQRESESSKASLRIEAIHGFLRHFAHKMIGSQRSRLSKEEAIEIIDDLYQRNPKPHWYPYDFKRDIHLHPTEVYDRLITCPLFRVSD